MFFFEAFRDTTVHALHTRLVKKKACRGVLEALHTRFVKKRVPQQQQQQQQ